MANLLILAQLKGTDADFRAWVQKQPSCIGGDFDQFVNGEGRSIAAHVKRASSGGIAFKGDFASVPMTNAEHQDQHKQGEAGCLERHLGGLWSRDGARDWFDAQRLEYLNRWLES